ncbi:hypothetical protein SMICM17S_13128 [Streptomyces microflavus]
MPASLTVRAISTNWPTSSPSTVAQTAPSAIAGTVVRVSRTGSRRSAHHTAASISASATRYRNQSPTGVPAGPAQEPSSSHWRSRSPGSANRPLPVKAVWKVAATGW